MPYQHAVILRLLILSLSPINLVMTVKKTALTALLICTLAFPSFAQDIGRSTGLPLPRFVSIKRDHANARRGPSRSHRIDWVYRRAGLPVSVIAEHEHWRKIVDSEGEGGWILHSLLSGRRTVIFQQPYDVRKQAEANSHVIANFEAGVIAKLLECDGPWCELEYENYRGWAPKSVLWGVATLADSD